MAWIVTQQQRTLVNLSREQLAYRELHNTVADAISRLEYDPSVNKTAESYHMTKVKGNSRSVQRQNWLTLSKHWCEVETKKSPNPPGSIIAERTGVGTNQLTIGPNPNPFGRMQSSSRPTFAPTLHMISLSCRGRFQKWWCRARLT